ncbi:MAG: hypothetical protein WA977_08485 [Halobacteriota archaeon]
MASEDYATEGQIKRLYAVLHSVGLDPTQWKKDQNIASYAKLTRAQCSGYIDEVEALEAEQKMQTATGQPQLPQKPDEKGQFGARAQAEAQRIREEQGRATAPATPPAATKPTVDELISKYLDILAKVTEAVNAEDRIPDREKGYGTKFLFYKVTAALENGGDHEEQV